MKKTLQLILILTVLLVLVVGNTLVVFADPLENVPVVNEGRIFDDRGQPLTYDFSAAVSAPFNSYDETYGYRHFSYLKSIDGKIAYCIEFEKIFNFIPVSERNQADSFPTITKEQENMINFVINNGYNGTPLGNYRDGEAYFATQVLIWQIIYNYVNQPEEAVLNAVFFEHMSGSATLYQELKTALFNAKLNTLPSFANEVSSTPSVYDLNYSATSGKYETVIEDTNGVLQEYTVGAVSQSGVTVLKSGNSLTIQSDKLCNTTIELTRNFTSGQTVYWIDGVHAQPEQALVTLYQDIAPQPVVAHFSVKSVSGNAQIVKTSEDGKGIKGIKFIVSGNGIDPIALETDEKGNTQVQALPPGKYKVEEVAASVPEGYVIAKPQEIEVTANETLSVKFHNLLQPIEKPAQIPNTGDVHQTAMWISICTLALAVVVMMIKNRNQQKDKVML